MRQMKNICLIIEIHQPMRLRTFRFFEIMNSHYYYEDYENEFIIKKTSEKFYLPANKILLDLIHFFKSSFKISFLFSGVTLDQFELYAPYMFESYKRLADTGCVEFLSGTYSNSFHPLKHLKEYNNQIKLQEDRIKSVFRMNPLAFQCRDLHNYIYKQTFPCIRISSGNRTLNNEISYVISGKNQNDWLLKPRKLAKLLKTFREESTDSINLFIPYYIFGDSQNKNSGVLEFLESFPVEIISKSDYLFGIPSETEANFKSEIEIPKEILRKNSETFYASCSELQNNAFEKLYSNCEIIEKCDDPLILKDWLYLQTCDHFYFMNPRLYEEPGSHRVFLPYDSHYFAYINYMNILTDFSDRLEKWSVDNQKDQKSINSKVKAAENEKGSTMISGTLKKSAGNRVNKMIYHNKKWSLINS